MSHIRDLISGEAELGSESDDEDFNEETGEVRPKQNGNRGKFEDSSEEDEDEDEEEARRVSEKLQVCLARMTLIIW